MAEGGGASEGRKMGVTRYVLSSAILGLFWTGLLKGVLTNSTSRCDYPPCSCDHYGRLTCDCKEEGEVGLASRVSALRYLSRVRSISYTRYYLPSTTRTKWQGWRMERHRRHDRASLRFRNQEVCLIDCCQYLIPIA
jgi:hypothetical protein